MRDDLSSDFAVPVEVIAELLLEALERLRQEPACLTELGFERRDAGLEAACPLSCCSICECWIKSHRNPIQTSIERSL